MQDQGLGQSYDTHTQDLFQSALVRQYRSRTFHRWVRDDLRTSAVSDTHPVSERLMQTQTMAYRLSWWTSSTTRTKDNILCW